MRSAGIWRWRVVASALVPCWPGRAMPASGPPPRPIFFPLLSPSRPLHLFLLLQPSPPSPPSLPPRSTVGVLARTSPGISVSGYTATTHRHRHSKMALSAAELQKVSRVRVLQFYMFEIGVELRRGWVRFRVQLRSRAGGKVCLLSTDLACFSPPIPHSRVACCRPDSHQNHNHNHSTMLTAASVTSSRVRRTRSRLLAERRPLVPRLLPLPLLLPRPPLLSPPARRRSPRLARRLAPFRTLPAPRSRPGVQPSPRPSRARSPLLLVVSVAPAVLLPLRTLSLRLLLSPPTSSRPARSCRRS
jgi:hypothetical protein